MSIWTHVNGNIRIDSMRFSGSEVSKINSVLGKIVNYDDEDWSTTLPCGSEGSLEYNIWENPRESSLSAYSVSIWGDLRDYSNIEEIKRWFNFIIKQFMVRDAILSISVEDGDSIILITEYDDNEGVVIREIK